MDDFVQLFEEEIKKRFTLVSLLPNTQSEAKLKEFLRKNKGMVLSPRKKFHTTLHYAVENPLFKREGIVQQIRLALPITLLPETYSFEVFGGSLVLKYENPTIRNLHGLLLEEGLRQLVCEFPGINAQEKRIFKEYISQRRSIVYGSFNQHISLARKFDPSNLEALSEFKEELTFDNFDWKI